MMRTNLSQVALAILLIILAGLVSACLPVTPLPPLPSETPTLAPTATVTIQWFPPTPTRTPASTLEASPTAQFQQQAGPELLADDFSDPSHWVNGNVGTGTVSLAGNEISLALTQPKGYLYSYRDEPFLGDFYLEITASPGLCAGLDEYGLLLRYNSPWDFYRFSLSCNGQTRLDKLVGGTASSPQPWLPSASVPSAAPSTSRLGVWAAGDELRFFINGEFQFAVNDRGLSQGVVGVFVRSGGENAVTVSFSDLVISQTRP